MRHRGGFPGVFCSIFVLLLVACTAQAQTTGDIKGRVTDSSGAPLPGVTLEATSDSLQGLRSTVSGRDGLYQIPGVPPGAYRVKALLTQFDPEEKGATVSLDATTTLDFSLRLSVREEVTVRGEAPLVDVTSTTTGTNYTRRVVEKLPVARNYADIVRANPGVFVDRGDTQGRSLALAIYGATSVENQWIIDGVNATNVIRGFQGKAINNEFVQEVEVKTGGYQAEYGRALGGVINVVTKSGGNDFHGDAFVYYDSQSTRAEQNVTDRDSVLGLMRISDYDRTDFGADLGGYILRDKLWFFAAYDRIEYPAKVSRYDSSLLVSNTLQFPLETTDNLYSGKLTWNLAAGSTLVGTVFADPTTTSGAGSADPRQQQTSIRLITSPDPGTWESEREIGGTDYGLRWNQLIGHSALATLQGSRHEDRFELIATGAGSRIRVDDLTCEGGTLDDPCAPPPNFAPNSTTGGLGIIIGFFNRNASHRNQLAGDVSLFLGPHEVKGGADYLEAVTDSVDYFTGGQRIRLRNERGVEYYQHTFYAVSPFDLTPVPDGPNRGSTVSTGAYIQDTWKFARSWTVNAGVRWDDQDVRDYGGATVFETTDEWQPRLGVIWDPRNDGSTKVYAFAGRFYYSLPTNLVVRAFGNQTFVNTFNFDPVGTAHDPSVPGRPRPNISGSFGTPIDEGVKGTHQDELTLGIERLLDPTFSLALKATYRTLGGTIEDRCDLDYSRPETDFSVCGIGNVGSGGRIARGDIPGCNGLDGDFYECTETIPATPEARRLYRGVELLLRKSFAEQSWVQASYVFSSLRGNYDGGVTAQGQTDPGVNADFDYFQTYPNSYGRLYLDRPHSFRFDGYYTAPFGLFVGLQGYVQSGAPRNRYGYLNQFYGALVQLVPRGSEGRLPTLWEANLTVGYPFRVGPVTATVQAYVFNLFDNQLATSVDESWSTNPPPDYPDSLFDPNQEQNNPEYGKVTSRQDPRLFRAALRIAF